MWGLLKTYFKEDIKIIQIVCVCVCVFPISFLLIQEAQAGTYGAFVYHHQDRTCDME